jgi:hypothetical protein
VFLAAATAKCAEATAEPVRSTWFEWHKFFDGTTADFSCALRPAAYAQAFGRVEWRFVVGFPALKRWAFL